MYSSSNTKPCTLLLLVGLKGAGKTFIGTVLEKHLDVRFLRIEPIFLELMRQAPALTGIPLEQRGFQMVLDRLDQLAQQHLALCIESTGTARTLLELLAALQRGYQVLLIQVQAPFETCAARVKTRDTAAHIPVSDDRLQEINQIAQQVELPWDLQIDNAEFLTESAIVQAVEALLQAKVRT
ncbi:MAG: ATP-binding protein [Cyanobacteria bacterium RM1_2_2]|nr:ATP-binding protein [Cyanobacteria bacterium RM1_2_2]